MGPLLFASNQAFSGKSSLIAGIGKLLLEKDIRIGYMKPLITLPVRIDNKTVDRDGQHIAKIFNLKDEISDICPVNYSSYLKPDNLKDLTLKDPGNYLDRIGNSLSRISRDKDLVLVEGARNIEDGLHLGLSSREICNRINSKAILIMTYSDELIDQIFYYREFFGKCFGGIIINRVPRENSEFISHTVKPFLENRKIKVFGYITSDKVLSSVSIREITEGLDGKILSGKNRLDELVETFMLGAMGPELALRFFRTKTGKAVITGGDRADIQLAALDTDTKCLILTGNFSPSTIVVGRAEELGIPMILVKYDTLTTVDKLNELLGTAGFHEFKKLDKIIEITRESIDLAEIMAVAGS